MRLIDADALLKSIESDRNCSDMPSQWIDGVNYAIDLIELYEPTIDIVRCRECKYARNIEGEWICEHLSGMVGLNVLVKADDFCSYGEREGE